MLDDDYQMGDHIKGSHGRARGYERRSSSFYKNWTGSARPSRKRARLHNSAIGDDETPIDVTPRRRLKLSDGPAVWNFYEQRFKNCQQTACKLIAKAWVKAVEPKKQSTHPYTGSDEKAPEWWPKPWGATKDDKVRHKEPDHLYKRGSTMVYLVPPLVVWNAPANLDHRTCPSTCSHFEARHRAQ